MLRQFLSEWLAWAKSDFHRTDFKPHPNFSKSDGLCCNYQRWLAARGLCTAEIYRKQNALVAEFAASGLSKGYPFGIDNYDRRAGNALQHTDPVRLAWVENFLKTETN